MPGNKADWRRGLFRAWIAISVVVLCVATGIAWPDLDKWHRPNPFDRFDVRIQRAPLSAYSDDELTAMISGEQVASRLPPGYKVMARFSNGTILEFPEGTGDDVVYSAVTAYQADQHLKAGLFTLAVGAAASFALLIIGAGMFWVVRGFSPAA